MSEIPVLVIDSAGDITSAVRGALAPRAYDVTVCDDPGSALEMVEAVLPELIVLRLREQGRDGMPLCHSLSRASRAGIVVLVEPEEARIDSLVALELGADAYLITPPDRRELQAHAKALLRRVHIESQQAADGRLELGGLELDRRVHAAQVDGNPVRLSFTEYRILTAMAQEPGRVFSPDDLRHIIGDKDGSGLTNVGVYVGRIRRKIERDPHNPARLLSVRGAGYKLVEA